MHSCRNNEHKMMVALKVRFFMFIACLSIYCDTHLDWLICFLTACRLMCNMTIMFILYNPYKVHTTHWVSTAVWLSSHIGQKILMSNIRRVYVNDVCNVVFDVYMAVKAYSVLRHNNNHDGDNTGDTTILEYCNTLCFLVKNYVLHISDKKKNM